MISLKSILTEIQNNIGIGLTYPLVLNQSNIAADTKSIIDNQAKVNYSIHVIAPSEIGEDRSTTGLTTARVDGQFGILIGIKNVADAIGSDVQDPLKDYRESVANVLTGFLPTGATRPLVFTSGNPIQLGNDGIFWQLDTYTTGYNLRQIL